MRYGFIYETTNNSNGMKYIGRHKRSQDIEDPDDSWYLGSGKYIKNSFKKAYEELGDNWYSRYSRVILCECDTENELYDKEEYYLNSVDAASNSLYYNMTNSSTRGWVTLKGENNPNYGGKCLTSEVRAKIRNTLRSNYKLGINKPWNKGKKMSDEFCQSIKDTWDYEKHYGEGSTARETMSSVRKEKYANGELELPNNSKESREKISLSLKEGYSSGRIKKQYGEDNPASRPEVRQKISDSVKIAMSRPEVREKSLAKGERLRNDENFKRKISEGRLGEKNPCYGKIWVNNGEYNKRVPREEFERIYSQQGFIEGRLYERKK